MNETGPDAVPPLPSGSTEPRMLERVMPEPDPPRFPAGLARAARGTAPAHERARPGRGPAFAGRLARAGDVGEVDAGARPAAEDHPLVRVPLEDRLHVVLHREDEAGAALRALFGADVEPDRRVEGGQLVQKDVRELGLEGVAVLD